MKKPVISIIVSLLVITLAGKVHSQGLPPGWEYNPTPSTHIISIPLEAEPNINGYMLQPGDWIGTFYLNDQGELTCGGATEWLGDQNTGVIAFGDDSFTPEKDGFDTGETINYKVYSWSVEKAYDAEVTCNDTMAPCNVFGGNVLSGVSSLDAYGFYIVAEASEDSICQGSSVQLNVIASGGSGSYTYTWYSEPPGFNANTASPTASPQQSTTYFVDVEDNAEVLTLSLFVEVIEPVTADAGEDLSICETNTAQLNGSVSNESSFLWTTDGDGTFSDPQTLSPVYTPGPGDIENGSAGLILSAVPIDPCTAVAASEIVLTIVRLPEVNAGDDQNVCETENVSTSPELTNVSSVNWSTTGDGTFDDPSAPNTTYVPGAGDLANGSVELTIAGQAIDPCTQSPQDSFVATFSYLPEVEAGENELICETETVQLQATASNYQSISWSSQGDGTFDDPGILNSVYTPGPDDILAGSVILVLSAESISPCIETVVDQLQVNITQNPTAVAGSDATICEDGDHQLNGNATNFDEILWTTSGDGTFIDPNALNTLYTPGDEDITNGTVIITLTAIPEFPCTQPVADDLTIGIQLLPVIFAGDDVTICENENLQLNASAENYSEIIWSSSGDGVFSDPNLPDAVYTPGSGDISNGSVLLSLTAEPVFPCTVSQQDDLLLSFQYLPEVFAGDDTAVCEDAELQLNATATNYLEVSWNTSGDGVFENPGSLNTIYTPGTQDLLNGQVTLTLTALPIDPCTLTVEDDLQLEIKYYPEAYAGEDATIQSDETLQLNGDASNQSLVIWATSGDGSFNFFDILNPVYTPGPEDIAIAGATLTLTAFPYSPCTVAAEDSLELTIDTVVNINTIQVNRMKVFPNPAVGEVFIRIPAGVDVYGIELVSIKGEVVLSSELINSQIPNNGIYRMDVSGIKPGVYLITLNSEDRIFSAKVYLKK